MSEHQMWDKFVDLKAEAIEERKERRKMGFNAYFVKLKCGKGYVVYNLPKTKLFGWKEKTVVAGEKQP